jgi:signal transduction histidine kinase
LTYVLSLTVLVGLYFGLATVVSTVFNNNSLIANQTPLSLAVVIVLLLVFQPIKLVFDRLTNRIFYRDYYVSDEFFANFNQILTSTTDLRTLLEHAANEIATTIKAEQTFFFINTFNGHYLNAGTAGHSQLPRDEAVKLQDVYGKRSGAIVAPMLMEDDPVRKLMLSHGIELMLPLFQADVVGYLCLGAHKTSHYTNRDIKVLRTIADEAIIAIHNTLSIEEVRQSNAMLRQMDKEKDEFVSIAGHELRTPMTVIRGSVSLLEREQLGPVNAKQKEVLSRMSNNTKGLIDLVNDMLDLSKLEADKMELKLVNSSVSSLVSEAFTKIQTLYDSKGIKLSANGPTAMIKTDTDKFERILLNLLSNSYKFTEAGGTVTVTTSLNQDEHYATITVTDTGSGIPEAATGILFKKFSQVDNYLQRQSNGTGLGLAICKELAEKLGGRIGVRSKLGMGSEFWFTMPMSVVEENGAANQLTKQKPEFANAIHPEASILIQQ